MNSPKTNLDRLQEDFELSLEVLDSLNEKIEAMKILLSAAPTNEYATRELRFAQASLEGACYDVERFQAALNLSA